jgi:integrase/recombinase XerD
LIKKLAEATDTALETEVTKTNATTKTIRNKIKPSGGLKFFAQADVYLQRLKDAGKYNQYTADKPRVKHFREFLTNDISFQDITPTLLENFKAQLITQHGHGERSAVNHLAMVRSVFSMANEQPRRKQRGIRRGRAVYPRIVVDTFHPVF